MFQREVAERIVAAPGLARRYGRLSVLAGWRSEARILFDIAASRLRAAAQGHLVAGRSRAARRSRSPAIAARSQRVTAAAFGQRRKMLRQSLKSLGVDPLGAAGRRRHARPRARRGDLRSKDFVALARAFGASGIA